MKLNEEWQNKRRIPDSAEFHSVPTIKTTPNKKPR